MFIKIYNKEIDWYVQKLTGMSQNSQSLVKEKESFNARCEKECHGRNNAWNKVRRQRIRAWEEYNKKRNDCKNTKKKKYNVRIIVNKCRAEPKWFYKYINSKLGTKYRISRLKVGEEI